ncbi:MAG: class I SAM-dependent methyltransferase, partial [Candidatus Subteraquimicrobiales bacterium]|nr:class I SAM-dependent methyltransferase [Candidatus Subteraquimicrobiales bacterium]
EWNRHSRTQYDSYTGTNISTKRFFEETKWSRDLRGQIILEVGSGSGRFTEQAALTGAMVVSMDYSTAVDANYKSNGNKENVLIVQGDIYSMPFKTNFFDKLFCIGVLQHTPDVEKAFFSLPKYLKPGKNLVIDVYHYNWWRYLLVTRYWVRPITKRLPSETLYKLCENYVNMMWRIARWINKLPKGRYINQALLIADYRGLYPLSEEMLKEWAILDTFDGLSPMYDKPQSFGVLKDWFRKSDLENVEIERYFNIIVGRATKPI